MKFAKKMLISSVGLLVLGGVLTACGSNQKEGASKKKDGSIEVTIPSYKTGENSAAKFFIPQVKRFNKKYEGKYKLVIEETPQASYGEKIKQLAQQKKLPVIIHGTGSGELDTEWFNKVVIENDLAYDLKPWLEKNSAIKDKMIEESVEYNTTKDGKILALPKIVVQPKAVFYNETLYKPKKEIRNMEVEEFFDSLQDNKIAFQTGENAWTTGLIWTILITKQEGGKEFLAKYGDKQLTDFKEPIIIDSVKELKEIFKKYSTSNSLGASYADAANGFMSGKAAVMPNGPWMTSDFSSDSVDKWSNGFKGENVRADLFPTNIGILTMQVHNEWVSNNATKEEKELAEAYLSFISSPEELEAYMLADGGSTPNYEPSADFMSKIKKNKLLFDMEQAVSTETNYVPNILDIMPPSVSENELAKLLPNLFNNKITPEEFCQQLTAKAAK